MTVHVYATSEDLEAYLGTSYAMPAEPERVLQRASEVIGEATFWRSEEVWHLVDEEHPATTHTDALRDAVCAQVEFWMESGEEFDTSNVQGSIAIGRLQIHRLPPKLAVRAFRFLKQAGLVSALVPIE